VAGAAAHLGRWEPAGLAEIASLFSTSGVPWWIAGGYAIELAVARPVRDHADVDVLVLRRDQLAVQRALPGWDWQAADPPGQLRPWWPGEVLPPGVGDLWCRPGPGDPWRIEIVLDESDGADWVSRRDARVRRPVASLGAVTAEGVPYLAPEIALFYKANVLRPKDETDFAAARPLLTSGQRAWLRDAIGLTYGPEHPWRARLADGG
jgi:hypothetical protein